MTDVMRLVPGVRGTGHGPAVLAYAHQFIQFNQ